MLDPWKDFSMRGRDQTGNNNANFTVQPLRNKLICPGTKTNRSGISVTDNCVTIHLSVKDRPNCKACAKGLLCYEVMIIPEQLDDIIVGPCPGFCE